MKQPSWQQITDQLTERTETKTTRVQWVGCVSDSGEGLIHRPSIVPPLLSDYVWSSKLKKERKGCTQIKTWY